jgi:hypothetical protein
MALEEPSTQEEALNLMYNRYKTETDQKKLENFVLNNKSGYT